uniref:Uncharacterized protein n=1 Tax=Anopheles atroparvus TaxID=41427 RepID=A0A182INQ3_ANOAO
MVVIVRRSLAMVVLLRGLVSLDGFPLDLGDEAALALDVVLDGALVAIGVDQVVFTLGGVVLPSLALSVHIAGVIIVHIVVVFVVDGTKVLFLMVIVLGLVGLLVAIVTLCADRCDDGKYCKNLIQSI